MHTNVTVKERFKNKQNNNEARMEVNNQAGLEQMDQILVSTYTLKNDFSSYYNSCQSLLKSIKIIVMLHSKSRSYRMRSLVSIVRGNKCSKKGSRKG